MVIAFLSGQIQAKNLRTAVVMTSGVGYRVSLPLSDISRLGEVGHNVSLHIHTNVREDAIDLYGFLSMESLNLFEHLINVSGVGPKLALGLLSGMDATQLANTLVAGDHLALTRIPGVGQKTAQRLVLELKDRLAQSPLALTPAFGTASSMLHDLRSAITNLGYKAPIVDKAVKSVEALAKEGLPLESLVKEALRHLN
jgi:Holliday junction DNA helicase RuvA